jgi:hypothetical protein
MGYFVVYGSPYGNHGEGRGVYAWCNRLSTVLETGYRRVVEGLVSASMSPPSSWRVRAGALGVGPRSCPYAPECVEGAFYEVGALSLLSDYGDRAMGVPDHRIRDTAQQSPP